jgi:large subunit ribosomal protein L4e
MKVPVHRLGGGVKGQASVARVFSERVRPDLIKRAVLAEHANSRQPYGADTLAGKRTSAHYHGRRGIRHSMMNREIARMKRIHNQGFLNLTARFVSQAVKGRKAHPPKAEKNWAQKINKKERKKALLSAIAASSDKDLVAARGHKLGGVKHVPLVVEDKLQELGKLKDVKKALVSLGLEGELERSKEKKVRAGKGKMRSRRYAKKKGPLFIIKEDKGIVRAGRNLPGVDIVEAKNLTVDLLAPGITPGRLCVWTESALKEMDKYAG